MSRLAFASGWPSTSVTRPVTRVRSPGSSGRWGSSNGASSIGALGERDRPGDRPRRAGAVAEGLLLHDVFDVDVAEQRPFARLADVDEPLLGGLVLLVGDVVLDDHLMDPLEDLRDQHVRAIRHRSLLLCRWRSGGAPAA